MSLPNNYVGDSLRFPVRLASERGPGFVRDDKVLVEIFPSSLIKATYTNVSTIDTDGIVTSHAGAGSAGTTTRTPNGALASSGIATLTPARNVVITVTHGSSVVAMSGTITGTRLGRAVTEAWSVTAGTTSKTFTGAVAFDTVTSITEVIAADASANTIIMGDGKVLGLPMKCACPSAVKEMENTTVVTNGTVVAASTSANADARGTYTPNTAPNGTNDWAVWYISDDLASIY